MAVAVQVIANQAVKVSPTAVDITLSTAVELSAH